MRELDTFYLDKKRMNTGFIFFDDYKKVKRTIEILESMHIPYFKTLYIVEGNKYCGFKVWNISRRFFELMACLKEVMK